MNSSFGKVAVLMGGWSAEREVSLNSGQAVLDGLLRMGVDAHKIDVGRDVVAVLQADNFDRVFNIVHGRGGEDGELQGALEIMQLPYTGCGIMASAMSMDKLMTKRLWRGMHLPIPSYRLLEADTDFDEVVDSLGLPLIVKPTLEGSSIGMSKVDKKGDLKAAYETAAKFGEVFAEKWMSGDEFTVAILGDEVLPSIRLQANNAFYDYEAKYQSDETQYFCPSGLSEDGELEIQALASRAFKAVGGRGWGRVDVMCNENNEFVLIEVNTVPGMTDHSLVPMAARRHGLSFDELVVRVLETATLNN
ncbi:MAG: D-alanine--D-alanine ligase [Thiotrichaceae bacterium]